MMGKGPLITLPVPNVHTPVEDAGFHAWQEQPRLLSHATEWPLVNIFWFIFSHIDLKNSFLRCYWLSYNHF